MAYLVANLKKNLKNSTVVQRLLLLKSICFAIIGLLVYWLTGKTPNAGYQAMIQAHCATSGKFTLFLGKIFSTISPYKGDDSIQNSVIGEISPAQLTAIIKQIDSDGFYIFDQQLPIDICDKLEQIARQYPCQIDNEIEITKKSAKFDENNPLSLRYRLLEKDVIGEQQVQELMADPLFRTIAGKYTESNSILCSVNIWWSAVFKKSANNTDYSAQQYHFDMSRARWLNFFVYLTDVDENNGPHCYVRGSHKFENNPDGDILLQRGYARIPDADIAAAYNAADLKQLTGKRGTIMAVDTRGFHKGKTLTKGHRLMFELVFSSSLYAGNYTNQKIQSKLHPALQQAMLKFRRTYQRYTVAG